MLRVALVRAAGADERARQRTPCGRRRAGGSTAAAGRSRRGSALLSERATSSPSTRTTICREVFSTSIRWYGSRGWTMISSSSSSHVSTAPQGTVTYPVTAGSGSAAMPDVLRREREVRQASGAVHEPDALAVDHGLLAVDPPHPSRVHLDERDLRRWVEVESARRTLAERATTDGQGHARNDRPSALRQAPPGLVQLRVDRARRPRREARHALELLLRRGQERLGRAEVPQDRPPSRGPDPLEVVEDRLEGAGVSAPAMEAEGEAVGLVPSTLEKLQTRVVPLEAHRGRASGDEHLLLALRERDDRHPRKVVRRVDRLERGRELPLASVDHDEVRDGREALVVAVGRRRRRAAARTFARRPGPSPRSRPGPRGRAPRRCGSARASTRRRRRPTSRRRSRCPGCSRRRSTRSAPAGSRG